MRGAGAERERLIADRTRQIGERRGGGDDEADALADASTAAIISAADGAEAADAAVAVAVCARGTGTLCHHSNRGDGHRQSL